MSHCEQILRYIERKGGITTMDAFTKLGCTRLSGRIYDLRQSGYKIVSVRKEGLNRFGEPTSYVEYRLGGQDE